jgi:hypothetical protein
MEIIPYNHAIHLHFKKNYKLFLNINSNNITQKQVIYLGDILPSGEMFVKTCKSGLVIIR